MLSCKEVTELVSQSIERRLSLREMLRLRMHLFVCTACSRFTRQMKFLHAAARAYARRGISAARQWVLSTTARDRIRVAIRRER
jgi:hypothetical protein